MSSSGKLLKLLLVNNLYPPYIIGGNEMLADDVVHELRRRGHDVHVATGAGKFLPDDGKTHCVLDIDLDHKEDVFLGGKRPTFWDLVNRHVFDWRSYRNLRQLIRQLDPDVVVAWNLYLASMSPIIAAEHERKPVVIQVADKWLYYGLKNPLDLIRPSRLASRWFWQAVRRVVQPLLLAQARPRRIITISDFIRRFYIAQGFRPESLMAIPLGVPTRLFTPSPQPRDGADHLRLIYVGALWEGKGPQVAVRALGSLARRGFENVTLDMYGAGTAGFKEWLKSIVVEEGLESRVTLNGFAPRTALLDAYRAHDILVFPSIWDEPFAAVPVEAMSCGLAVVASTAGGTPEAIVDGETGLLVPPNDVDRMAAALERVIVDVSLRRRLGESAARVARERFDFDHYVTELEDYYRGVVLPT